MAKKTVADLDRDQQILSRLARIEQKIDSLGQTNAFSLRAEADKHFASAKQIFKRSKRRAQIYMAADGMRSVNEIADHLQIPRQNVGQALKLLREESLLGVDRTGGRDIYSKMPIDKTHRISAFIRQEYSLDAQGRPVQTARKRR